MVAGIEDHRHINMKKESVRGGITGTLSPISPRLQRTGRGDSLTQQKHWNPITSMMSTDNMKTERKSHLWWHKFRIFIFKFSFTVLSYLLKLTDL